MDLVNDLAKQLGINADQAKGGLGLILQKVQEQVSAADFQQVASALPNVQGLLDSAPKAAASGGGGLLGSLGGLASSLGLNDLGKLASLAEGFKKLGLDPAMVLKFVPAILAWAQKQGPAIKAILEKVLKA